MCDHSWGRTSNKARATCIILINSFYPQEHHDLEQRARPEPPVSYSLSIIIIEHRNRQEPSVSYSPLHDHQEHHVNDDHQPSNKARAIFITLSPQVFFMIITIIIEYRTRPYQPATCSDKDIRFHSDPQSSMT